MDDDDPLLENHDVIVPVNQQDNNHKSIESLPQ